MKEKNPIDIELRGTGLWQPVRSAQKPGNTHGDRVCIERPHTLFGWRNLKELQQTEVPI